MFSGLVAYKGSDSEGEDEEDVAGNERKNAVDAQSKPPTAVASQTVLSAGDSLAPSRSLPPPPPASDSLSLQASLRFLPSPKITSNKRVLITVPHAADFDSEIDADTDAWLERKKRLASQANSLADVGAAKRSTGLLAALPKPSGKGITPRSRAVGGVASVADTAPVVAGPSRPLHSTGFRLPVEDSDVDFETKHASTSDKSSIKANDIIRNAERQTLDYLQQVMKVEPHVPRASASTYDIAADVQALHEQPEHPEDETTSGQISYTEHNVEQREAPSSSAANTASKNHPQSMMIRGKCVEVVDVNADDHLIGTDRAVLMSLTGRGVQPMQPSTKWVKSVAPAARRKHQITYLAAQAKAREAELQDHWATGRANKQSAAKKYGF